MIANYLSALRSYHIDRHISLEAFNKPQIAWIIKGEKRLFPRAKTPQLPITKNILKKITKPKSTIVNKLNIDTAFKEA